MSEDTDTEELKHFISRLKIKEIRCLHLSLVLDETSPLVPNKFEFKLEEKIDYGFNDNVFNFKIGAYAKVLNDDSVVGNLETKFAFIHDFEPGDAVSPQVIEKFLSTTGLMVAFPYIREIIHSTMVRFGLSGLILDYMRRPD